MNWILITTLALSLNGNSNIGLAGAVSGAELTSTFAQVTLVQSEASEVRKQEEVLTPEKRGMAIRHYEPREMWRESVAGVAFSADALDANTLIKLSTTDEPATNYPDDPYFTKNYPADKVRYLGPLTTVEIPLDTLNWRGEEEKSLFDISPSFYQGVIGNVAERDIFLEVRIPRPDGQLVFYTFDFGFFGTARFSNKFLQTNLLGSEPETLVISVQAVDLSGVLNAPSPTSPQNKRDEFNLGLVANVQNGNSQGQFEEVLVQQGQGDEQPLESGKSIVDGLDPVEVILPSGATTSVGSGSLKSAAEISLNVYADRPSGRDARFIPVGPRAVVEIPLSALNLANPDTNLVKIWMPADPKLKQEAYSVLQEVSITLGDGTEYVYLDQYGDQWAVKITPAILASIFRVFPTPDILRISVQPVDMKSWHKELAPDLFDENDSSSLKS